MGSQGWNVGWPNNYVTQMNFVKIGDLFLKTKPDHVLALLQIFWQLFLHWNLHYFTFKGLSIIKPLTCPRHLYCPCPGILCVSRASQTSVNISVTGGQVPSPEFLIPQVCSKDQKPVLLKGSLGTPRLLVQRAHLQSYSSSKPESLWIDIWPYALSSVSRVHGSFLLLATPFSHTSPA